MINFFRSFFQSKLGLGLTIGFLVLIALAFAAGEPEPPRPPAIAEPELPLDGRPDLGALELALTRRLAVVRTLRDLTRERAAAEAAVDDVLAALEA